MNWVGGARNRFMARNDARKQKEFFERSKMQKKLKNLGIPLPSSPQGSTSTSLDLVTLFVVNQIATKKENKDPPKVGVFSSNRKRASAQKRNESLVLPMSPGSPSRLSLMESRPRQNSLQSSLQAIRKRKQVIPPGFKCQQLSPVLESAFSDNSAPDYVPAVMDPLSPFSSTSSASSGQGRFPLQLNLHQRGQPRYRSPPPWDAGGLEPTVFQPFSLPRGMTDAISWSSTSSSAFYHSEAPSAATALFGGPESDHATGAEATFSLQAMDEEPMFTLSQEQSEQHFQQDVFGGFSSEGCQVADNGFTAAKKTIYLRDETPVKSSTPQSVPQPQCFSAELSNCTDTDFSCTGLSLNGSNHSPSYCCGGYLSSESTEEEDCCQPGEGGCCAAAANQIPTSQGDRKQSQSRLRPLMPHTNPQSITLDCQTAAENDTTLRSNGDARIASPRPLAGARHPDEPCRCKKAAGETQDAGTQTDGAPVRKCHTATQCSLLSDGGGGGGGGGGAGDGTHPRRRCSPPVGVSLQRSATGGQADLMDAASLAWRGGTATHTPWSRGAAAAASSSGRENPQRHINPFTDATDAGKQLGDGRGQEKAMIELSGRAMTKAAPAAGVCRLSNEAETLEEIADILLLLKQRRKEE